MSTLSIIVLIFYMLFTLLTVIVQNEGPKKEKLKKLDMLNIVPNYKFFCPKPVRYDYHLYYRVIDNRNPTDWQKVPIGKKKNGLSFVWNPYKKEKKAFTRMIQLIRQQYKGRKKKTYGYMYMTLLDFVRSQATALNGNGIQFRITYNQNLVDNSAEKVFYTSILHKR